MPTIINMIATYILSKQAPMKTTLVHTLLTGIAAIVGLAVVIAILTGALILGGIYYAHSILLHSGYNPEIALAITAAAVLAIIAGITVLIVAKIKELQGLPKQFVEIESPIPHRLNSIAQSFLDGLKNPAESKTSANNITKLPTKKRRN